MRAQVPPLSYYREPDSLAGAHHRVIFLTPEDANLQLCRPHAYATSSPFLTHLPTHSPAPLVLLVCAFYVEFLRQGEDGEKLGLGRVVWWTM